MKAMKKEKLFTRNFTLLILGQVSSLTGNYTLKFALSMYVLEQTGSASIFAGMLSAALLPTVLLSPFGGILADRANRKHIMVALDALSGLSVLAVGLLLPLGRELWVIGALLVLLSVLAAFESPTVQACVPQMVSPQNLVQGNAVVSQVSAVTSLVTPFLGSLFYTAFGIGPVFAAAVACFWLTALLECMIRLEYQKPPRTAGIGAIVREDLAVSAHFLRREQPDILKLLLLAALAGMFVSGTAVVGFPYLVRTVLGLSATYYGAAESAMGAAAILGSLCAGLLGKKLRVRDMAAIFLSFGLSLFPIGFSFLLPVGRMARYGVLLFFFCVCQLGVCIFSTYAITLIQQRTPEQLMGKVMSCVFTLSMCAQPVGQVVYGALFDCFSDSVYWVLIPTGMLICLIAVASRGFLKRMAAAEKNKKDICKSRCPFSDGGDDRDRTDDLLNAIQTRSQLSYTPIFTCRAAGPATQRRILYPPLPHLSSIFFLFFWPLLQRGRGRSLFLTVRAWRALSSPSPRSPEYGSGTGRSVKNSPGSVPGTPPPARDGTSG